MVFKGNYFGEEPIKRTVVEVRVGNPKKGKNVFKDEVMRDMIKSGGDRVVVWIWRPSNMDFDQQ